MFLKHNCWKESHNQSRDTQESSPGIKVARAPERETPKIDWKLIDCWHPHLTLAYHTIQSQWRNNILVQKSIKQHPPPMFFKNFSLSVSMDGEHFIQSLTVDILLEVISFNSESWSGWCGFNPSEKYDRQIGNLPQVSGWKFQKYLKFHHLVLNWDDPPSKHLRK